MRRLLQKVQPPLCLMELQGSSQKRTIEFAQLALQFADPPLMALPSIHKQQALESDNYLDHFTAFL